MHYVKEPTFWIAVVVVAIVVNWAWKMLTGKGQLL